MPHTSAYASVRMLSRLLRRRRRGHTAPVVCRTLSAADTAAAEKLLAAHARIPVERSFLRALAYTGQLAVGAWRDGQLVGVAVGLRGSGDNVWSQIAVAGGDRPAATTLAAARNQWLGDAR